MSASTAQLQRHLRPLVSTHHVNRRPVRLVLLIGVMGMLQLMAGVGLAYVVGFSHIRHALGRFDWPYVIVIAGALLISFAGYFFTYRTIYEVDAGPGLSPRQMLAVVTAGFGGFLAHGGSALDKYAIEAAGAGEREAKVRVASLAGLEHGILGFVCDGAAIVVLALALSKPPLDFAVPWAVIPVPGLLLAFWLAEKNRDRFRGRQGWRGSLSVFVDSILLIKEMFRQPRRFAFDLAGMAVFWLGEMLAAWAGLAMFGFRMNGAQLIVAVGTGMVFTRRTGPLGGAGVLGLVLPLTLWYSGAPFAVAVVGVFAYRVISLWLPLPFSIASLPTLRQIGEEEVPGAEGHAEPPGEPALRKGA